ncbi:hemocyanin A chain-like [Portunus trituberculatus]|uniref:hemocyanin A chain-like n=1 Tax=Portunus trituberculatus TaxID=210409 RepID=UPI001E1CE06D|nr:hemocyanin A chain-like [Portunus trituberculatus]
MKLFVLCSLVVAAAAWPSLSDFQGDQPVVTVARKQQDVNGLLHRIYDDLAYPEVTDIIDTFETTLDVTRYKDGGVAIQKLLKELHDHRLASRHHVFSLFNTRQREEALMLFEVFMQCQTWDEFSRSAIFFRKHMNEGEFVYAIYVAIIHSPLGKGIVLPPLYEVTPHLFTNSEIINKAYTAQMTNTQGSFRMNFTGSRRNPEQQVAYFGEDIGMNVHHVTWHMDFPFWWTDSYGHHIDRKGELFFWVHHQLSARYNSERLSNWMNVVDELSWESIIKDGFAPHTSYKFGGEFPARPDNVRFTDVKGVARVRDMVITEHRIRDAIARGFIVSPRGETIDISNEHGINILGDVIESSTYSPNVNYYGSLHNTAHIMLGRQGDPQGKFNMPPGVMEHFETATRDPSFFRLHKYMDNIFKEHKDSFDPYTKEDLAFPGVSIESINIDGELRTYFEEFEFDLENAADHSESSSVDISARVPRLNHKEFSYNFEINNNNDDEVEAAIRVYLCPEKDSHGIQFTWDEGRWHCIEMDKFWRKLSSGANMVVRKSSESSVTRPDSMSFKVLRQKADEAVAGGYDLNLEKYAEACGIPDRMLLPKGKANGMDFALMVFVTPDAHIDESEVNGNHAHCGRHGQPYPDPRPMGYPLDRRIPDKRVFLDSPNTKFINVKVFHGEQ